MTRLWIRNLTSRNDSRTGAWVIRRWAGGVAPLGPLGAAGPPGAAGTPGEAGAGPAPGRALSIRFSSDISSTPYRAARLAVTDDIIGMRTRTSSWPPYGLPRAGRRPPVPRRSTGPGGGCPATPAPPGWRGRTVHPD